MTRVLSVSSSRADVGILGPVWRALAQQPEIEIHLLLTGAHVDEPTLSGDMIPARARVHRGGCNLAGRPAGDAANAMAAIAEAAGATIGSTHPDAVVLIGDRLDMIPAALAALPFNVPVVHLHGGEISEGAIDERSRHAMTKLAHLHCVATVDAAKRVCRMGEERWRIHVTGAPGLDSLREAPEMSAHELAAALEVETIENLCLATVHPETNSVSPALPLEAVLGALDASPRPTVLTAPNADPGAADMRARIDRFAAERPWAVFRDTLGVRLYANVLRHAALMLGNSSSGIVEAGLFELPVIDVGRRQKGRVRDANVRNCESDAASIARLLDEVGSPVERPRKPVACLYGDGRAAPRIAAVVAEALGDRERVLFKRFSEEAGSFTAPWKSETPGASNTKDAAA